jgi:predicted acylesterase/phospholipase RssA
MNKIGLALSGGGFRASLYHLGLIRFLRDAGILSQVTHITSVSGGSIIAAHLALNWDRYNGSPEEFDAVASELLSFVNLDIRNRIIRRFPLNIPFRLPRRFLGLSNRKLTRTGLLERHYEKYLYGDTSLFELPENPKLHILSTDLSEGCLCSFNRDGLLMVRRQPEKKIRIDRIKTGLATVAMAVTSSSAFAGFFPPIELTGAEVGVNEGEFGRQAYTDGGVFDNLGVRMFRCLQPYILAESPLSRDDFFDARSAIDALAETAKAGENTPLRRLAEILRETMSRRCRGTQSYTGTSRSIPPVTSEFDQSAGEELVFTCLWDAMKQHAFQVEPLFENLKLVDPDAEALLHASRVYGVLNAGDQLWLNRHILEAAFRQATGHPCFRRLNSGLDGVLVSDVGKHIQVAGAGHAGGLIRTALRATDILMERVWELENERFRDMAGFVFAPINQVVDPAEDPTALHPEIQRHLANIRTDLDRFSRLEISSLIRHGYCVGRKVCREHVDLFGANLPRNSPWDPIAKASEAISLVPVASRQDEESGELTEARAEARRAEVSSARRIWRILPNRWARHATEPSPTTVEARTLKASAGRRIWSTILDYRDWVSYLYVPILVPMVILLPYFVTQYYESKHRANMIIQSVSQGNPAITILSRLLRDGPDKPLVGVRPEPAGQFDDSDLYRFGILGVSHVIDLRLWNPAKGDQNDSRSNVHIYRALKVRKEIEKEGEDIFRYAFFAANPKAVFRFPRQALQPKLHMVCDSEKDCRWEVHCDFTTVPAGQWRDIIIESQTPAAFLKRGENSTAQSFEFASDIAEVDFWILMPRERQYRDFRLMRYKKGEPGSAEAIIPATQFLAEDSEILAFKMLATKPLYRYEMSWEYN